MINYSEFLNNEQLNVVMSEDGPILVIAGAGSGKTRALTYRVARLIETGARPEQILLATFTNKAARSMLSRVTALVDTDVEQLWGGTFHHLGNRILRRHAPLLGYDHNYTIIDSGDSQQLLQNCIADLGLNVKDSRFPKTRSLGEILSLAANTEENIDNTISQRYPFYLPYITDILKIALRYRIRKKELNLMDFDDLLLNWKMLLEEHSMIQERYSEKFFHILVDEYQDTNTVQAAILDLLASSHRNLMVVGDDSQSIYSFRGADFTNIIRFPEKYPDARIFKLETNYRSTPEILHLANMSIINNERQFQKELRAVRNRGNRPIFVPVRDVYQQADFISQRIWDLKRGGTPLQEIAILYRAHYHSMELQMEFVRQGIPFEIRSGLRFFEQAHIKDITAFMRLIVNPYDEIAWKRVLTLYSGIGKKTADKVWKFVVSSDEPLSAVTTDSFISTVPKKVQPTLKEFSETFKRVLDISKNNSPSQLIPIILDSGYREYLEEKYGNIVSREEDLQQLAGFSATFESLEAFLSDMALLTDIAEENDIRYGKDQYGKVVMSSIHQAKGLEWSVVFMIWCSEGMIPLARALKEPEGEGEERRLFYVATTRAKDQLYFCHPVINRAKNNGYCAMMPSRFLKELAPEYLDPEDRPFDQWVVEDACRY